MFEDVMQSCAGVRRPGAAALDLCYVAAGCYDGFFETGLSPWDMAAGSLMVTEAGGLIGNFTGDADFLYQREVVAGNPKIYGQLVQLLAPFTARRQEPKRRRLPQARRPRRRRHIDARRKPALRRCGRHASPRAPDCSRASAATHARGRRQRAREATARRTRRLMSRALARSHAPWPAISPATRR